MEVPNTKKGFLIYLNAYRSVMRLSPEQRGWLLSVLMEYAEGVAQSPDFPVESAASYANLEASAQFVCDFMTEHIRRDTLHWQEIRDVRRRAAQEREARRARESAAGAPYPRRAQEPLAPYPRRAAKSDGICDRDGGDLARYIQEVKLSRPDGQP